MSCWLGGAPSRWRHADPPGSALSRCQCPFNIDRGAINGPAILSGVHNRPPGWIAGDNPGGVPAVCTPGAGGQHEGPYWLHSPDLAAAGASQIRSGIRGQVGPGGKVSDPRGIGLPTTRSTGFLDAWASGRFSISQILYE